MSTTTVHQLSEAGPPHLHLLGHSIPDKLSDPAYQAYLLLRVTFVAAPILFGVDKFFNWMTFWPKYLWVGFPHWLDVSPLHFMYGVGVIEIVAGVGVLLLPRLASYVVAGWLGGIIVNSIILSATVSGHAGVTWDIALRDFGLFVATLALARLSAKYAPVRLARLEAALDPRRLMAAARH